MKRHIVGGLLLIGAAVLALWAGSSQAGDNKGGWTKFLSPQLYQELLQREAKTIAETDFTKDDSIKKGQAAAVLAAALTHCVKDGTDRSKARATAIALALLVKNKKADDVKKYSTALGKGGDESLASPTGTLKEFAELHDIMVMYTFHNKGGDGVHPDLQLNKKLKTTQNSIEEFLRTIARKPPEGDTLDKAAKELELLAYRVAVHGALTHQYAPKDKAADWHKFSIEQRDRGIQLANLVRSKDNKGIAEVAEHLNNACLGCHAAFRK